MADVTVTLNTSGPKPQLDFNPLEVPIAPKTKETIHWKRAGSNFKFAALAFDHKNPFSNVVVGDDKISADDDNQEARVHAYVVLFSVNGTYYSSSGRMTRPGPTIRNN